MDGWLTHAALQSFSPYYWTALLLKPSLAAYEDECHHCWLKTLKGQTHTDTHTQAHEKLQSVIFVFCICTNVRLSCYWLLSNINDVKAVAVLREGTSIVRQIVRKSVCHGGNVHSKRCSVNSTLAGQIVWFSTRRCWINTASCPVACQEDMIILMHQTLTHIFTYKSAFNQNAFD